MMGTKAWSGSRTRALMGLCEHHVGDEHQVHLEHLRDELADCPLGGSSSMEMTRLRMTKQQHGRGGGPRPPPSTPAD